MKRVVIITGGTKGLGRELSLAFGRTGYFVMSLYSADEDAAQELRALLDQEDIGGCVMKHDVSSESTSVWSLPELQNAESLVLIHNACAQFSPIPLHKLNWQDFEDNYNTAVKGCWLCSQALIRLMLKQGHGTIVNILSSAVDGSAPKGFAAYVTAKHALRGLTLALAAEYGPRGVKIFSASPGFMDTPLTEKWDPNLRELIRSASGRVTLPVEAAKRVLQLVQDHEVANGENFSL